jgi:cytochrome o ubiquinol oxidase operon protein cyoD
MTGPKPETSSGKLSTYIIGYLLSLEITLVAYYMVSRAVHNPSLNYRNMVAYIAILAVVQLMVQLVCFLHLGRESKPRWNLSVLLFAVMVVVIIVFGSLWIMDNLNYHMDDPNEVNKYIRSQSDL